MGIALLNPSYAGCIMKSKPQTSWYLLSQSYLYTANLLADEVHDLFTDVLKRKNGMSSLIHLLPLTFSSIFNARHGIELFLKSLIAIQKNSESLERKYQKHDLVSLFQAIKEGRDGLIPIYSITQKLDGVCYEDDLLVLCTLVDKYQKYSFQNFPAFVDKAIFEDIDDIDDMNMRFRFPDSSSINKATRLLFDEHFDSRGDIDVYLQRNFQNLHSIIELAREIKGDVRDMFRISESVGNTVAANANESRSC